MFHVQIKWNHNKYLFIHLLNRTESETDIDFRRLPTYNIEIKKHNKNNMALTLFRNEGGEGVGKKAPSSSLPSPPPPLPAPTNFQLVFFLVLILLPHWCKISKPYLVPLLNYWTWTKITPQKSCFLGQILIKLRFW